MSKYTMTIEDYCLGRFIAGKLALDPDYDPRLAPAEITPEDAYATVAADIFPASVPFYTTDSAVLDEFIKSWTDIFYFSEIGQETLGKFTWTLRAWLRDNMGYYSQLYASQIGAVADLMEQSDYKRQLTETLRKTGSETRALQHGMTVTDNPGQVSKNSIIPLGGTAETELSQTAQSGQSTTSQSGTDTTTITPNTTDTRTVTEIITGYQGQDKAHVYEAYRQLILDIDSEIFRAMRRDGLFMEVW